MSRVRALVLQEFGRLRVEERPRPEPGPGEALIRVVATGICGSDVHGYTGENGRRQPGQVMGHESVGRVVALGPGADGPAEGQPVTFNPIVLPSPEDADAYAGREQHCPGKTVIGVTPEMSAAFADYLVVPARNTVPLPQEVPLVHGALIEPLAVALHAVRRVLVPTDRRALVLGGGPIGQSTVLALRHEGVETVYLSEIDAGRRALCERLGATVFDPAAGPVPEAVAALDQPVDVALDAVGTGATVSDALDSTALGGRVCLVGMGAPSMELDAFRISTEERSLVGSFTYSARDFEDAAAQVRQPGIGALVSREVEPEEADAAFAELARGEGPPGKVLVRFS